MAVHDAEEDPEVLNAFLSCEEEASYDDDGAHQKVVAVHHDSSAEGVRCRAGQLGDGAVEAS